MFVCKYITCINSIGAINLDDSEFSESNKPEVVDTLLCDGTESNILDCVTIFEGSESCGQYEDAGIVCQGMLKLCFITMQCMYASVSPY